MPNRILRDWTDSYTVEPLSAEGERLFVRLIMKADDFGRYHADPRLVRAGCFPLLSRLRDTDITHWIAECEKAGLILVYQSCSRSYLAIVNFKQRARADESKFPAPDGKPKEWRPVRDGPLTVTCQADDGQLTAKTETYAKTEAEAGAKPVNPPPDPEKIPDSNGYPLPIGEAIPKPLYAGTAMKMALACDQQIETVRHMAKDKREPIMATTAEGTEYRKGWKLPKEAEAAIKAWEKRKQEIQRALAG
jgi:hypothetical protein